MLFAYLRPADGQALRPRVFDQHPGEMPEEFVMIGYRDGTERSVCDFLSCMTDRYATRKFQELFVPSAFPAF